MSAACVHRSFYTFFHSWALFPISPSPSLLSLSLPTVHSLFMDRRDCAGALPLRREISLTGIFVKEEISAFDISREGFSRTKPETEGKSGTERKRAARLLLLLAAEAKYQRENRCRDKGSSPLVPPWALYLNFPAREIQQNMCRLNTYVFWACARPCMCAKVKRILYV